MNEPELITLSSDSDTADSCDIINIVPPPHPQSSQQQQQPKEVQILKLTIPSAPTSLKIDTERNDNGSPIPKRKRMTPRPSHVNESNSDTTSISEKPMPEVPSTSACLKNGLKSVESSPKAGTSSNNGEKDLVSEYEAKLELIINRIKEYDKQECDWENEANSSYLIKDRLCERLMKLYTEFCKKFGYAPKLTHRPVQKRFELKKVTKYPELDSAVEKYLNTTYYSSRKSKGDVAYAAPDYNNILDVVTKEIEVKKIAVIPSDVTRIVQELFKHTVNLYKIRRIKDLLIAFPNLSDSDPAQQDPELEKKLKENASKRRKEEEVLAEFTLKQEQAGGEDNEESEEETEEEEGDEDDEVQILPNEPNQ